MKKQVPHDALIKKMLEEPGFPKAFFDTILPERLTKHLRWESLKLARSSFVDEELRQHFSDAFFEAELKTPSGKRELKIALLLEHKSSPDRFVVLQLMRYLLQAYLAQINERVKGKGKRTRYLIPILPVVVYQGKTAWKARTFAELFGRGYEEFSEYFLELPFLFFHINQLSDEEILAMRYSLVQGMVLSQKYSHDSQLLFMYIGLITEILGPGNTPSFLLVYILEALKDEYTKDQIFEQINPAMATKFRSFYDKLMDEGIEKGIKKGIELGKDKGQITEKENTIHRMDKLGFSVQLIAQSVELSVEKVLEILKK